VRPTPADATGDRVEERSGASLHLAVGRVLVVAVTPALPAVGAAQSNTKLENTTQARTLHAFMKAIAAGDVADFGRPSWPTA
jgi:hypothetical protein